MLPWWRIRCHHTVLMWEDDLPKLIRVATTKPHNSFMFDFCCLSFTLRWSLSLYKVVCSGRWRILSRTDFYIHFVSVHVMLNRIVSNQSKPTKSDVCEFAYFIKPISMWVKWCQPTISLYLVTNVFSYWLKEPEEVLDNYCHNLFII